MRITQAQAQSGRKLISKALDIIGQDKIKAKQKKCRHWLNADPEAPGGEKAYEKYSKAREWLIDLRRQEKILVPILKLLRQVERGIIKTDYDQGFDDGFQEGLENVVIDENGLWQIGAEVTLQSFQDSEFEEVAETLTERGVVKVFASDCDDEEQSVFCTEIDTLCFNKNSEYPYYDSESEDLWKYVQLVVDNDE